MVFHNYQILIRPIRELKPKLNYVKGRNFWKCHIDLFLHSEWVYAHYLMIFRAYFSLFPKIFLRVLWIINPIRWNDKRINKMALTCKTIRQQCVIPHQKSEKMHFHRYNQGKETLGPLKTTHIWKKFVEHTTYQFVKPFSTVWFDVSENNNVVGRL